MGLMPKHWPLNTTIVTSLFSIFGSGAWDAISLIHFTPIHGHTALYIWRMKPNKRIVCSRDIALECKATRTCVSTSSGRI